MDKRVDVFISGGGIAGLTAAVALRRLGLSVTLADPAPPATEQNAQGSDLRSTAFLQPARNLLEDFGIWPDFADVAVPLEALRVVDLSGDPPAVKTDRIFQSSDLGEAPFAWNLPNWLVRQRLCKIEPDLDIRFEVGFQSMLRRDRAVLVRLTDGSTLRAGLVLAADGVASPVRVEAGIEVDRWRYGQKAMAFVAAHELPHQNVSTELYHSGGAFTLVPLPDQNGNPASAVVWMNDGPRALELKAMSDEDLGEEATKRSASILGDLQVSSPVRMWPVVTQRAKRMVAKRVALMAEAAHVLPPIGAQGLNTSLADVRVLIDLVQEGVEPGSEAFLGRYAKRRESDIATRARVVDLYNRVCRSGEPPVQALRSLGLSLVHDISPLRQAVMRAGMG